MIEIGSAENFGQVVHGLKQKMEQWRGDYALVGPPVFVQDWPVGDDGYRCLMIVGRKKEKLTPIMFDLMTEDFEEAFDRLFAIKSGLKSTVELCEASSPEEFGRMAKKKWPKSVKNTKKLHHDMVQFMGRLLEDEMAGPPEGALLQ